MAKVKTKRAKTEPAKQKGKPIDINEASVEELTVIEGVNEERARLIVEYRQQHGPFSSWDDLENVPGIGAALREKAEAAASIADADETEDSNEIESDDETSVLVREANELIAVAELDREAAAAYHIAAEHIADPKMREQLMSFRDDHLRHVSDIESLLKQRDMDLPGDEARAESSAIAALALAAREMGTRAALLAMISNERLTNGTYESALLVTTDEEARALLERNLGDERRHLRWLEANKDRAFDVSVDVVQSDPAG